jgi:hypothetical protein
MSQFIPKQIPVSQKHKNPLQAKVEGLGFAARKKNRVNGSDTIYAYIHLFYDPKDCSIL